MLLQTEKKHITRIALFFFIPFLALLLYSCKDDNTSSPKLSTGAELYYLDSAYVRTSGTDSVSKLEVFNCYEYSIREVKVRLTGETNIDSINGICLATFTVCEVGGSQIVTYHEYIGITSVNKYYEYTVSIPQNITQWSAQFFVRIVAGFNSESKFIKLKDISIIKLNS
jgi:hypothetical protein